MLKMFNMKKLSLCAFVLLVETLLNTEGYPTYGQVDAHLGGGLGAYNVHEPAHSLVSNDHHGGVSIVGAGGSAQKGITLDLTKDGGPAHSGLFGGSFISSGGHGKSGGYFQGGADDHSHTGHSGLGAYSSGLSSYDVGSHQALSSAIGGHDAGETSPVLYSSFKDGEHNHFGLHSGGLGGGFESHAALSTAPQHFGGGIDFSSSHEYGH